MQDFLLIFIIATFFVFIWMEFLVYLFTPLENKDTKFHIFISKLSICVGIFFGIIGTCAVNIDILPTSIKKVFIFFGF